MKPAAIILAGGESRRMGTPKALLQLGSETFAGRLARVLGTVAAPVLLVTGAEPSIQAAGARMVHNPDWRDGQLTSLQAGLRQVPADAPAVFFAPVDCPAFAVETVEALWAAFQTTHAVLTIPRLGDRRGHPVLARADLIPEFLALPPNATARDVIHPRRSETLYVDVDDQGILADIDTPEAYREWTEVRA